ncbi:hypothetical protein THRCLA_20431 [Thraustotheca clavata]|uniref:Complex 1 LYR protein domain-containing protein n=1 Tax=Thraustotheca clavata TaxID=74557 RepID=A0A1W0A767_9STRA|nr:hypothetical protein THRCLA_20431 [Thraustotheca clavata]
MDTIVRSAYKKLIKLARSVPVDQREATLEKIRTEFRTHKDVATAEELDQLLRKAQSKISYLKIVTPKRSASSRLGNHFVYKNGQRYDGSEAIADGAKVKTQDYNEMMKKHVQLVRRQHFMDRK